MGYPANSFCLEEVASDIESPSAQRCILTQHPVGSPDNPAYHDETFRDLPSEDLQRFELQQFEDSMMWDYPVLELDANSLQLDSADHNMAALEFVDFEVDQDISSRDNFSTLTPTTASVSSSEVQTSNFNFVHPFLRQFLNGTRGKPGDL